VQLGGRADRVSEMCNSFRAVAVIPVISSYTSFAVYVALSCVRAVLEGAEGMHDGVLTAWFEIVM
jgi:hypothetical protein